jgi:hypothetical protein
MREIQMSWEMEGDINHIPLMVLLRTLQLKTTTYRVVPVHLVASSWQKILPSPPTTTNTNVPRDTVDRGHLLSHIPIGATLLRFNPPLPTRLLQPHLTTPITASMVENEIAPPQLQRNAGRRSQGQGKLTSFGTW